MAKKEFEEKKELARALYFSGMQQNEIADKVAVSRVTVNRWVNDLGWQEMRAARNITRPELVNKLLLAIDKLIEQANNPDDPAAIAAIGDRLSKLSAVVERLDKDTNVVTIIEVFIAFSKWIEYRAATDQSITLDFRKQLTKLQDQFIIERANGTNK